MAVQETRLDTVEVYEGKDASRMDFLLNEIEKARQTVKENDKIDKNFTAELKNLVKPIHGRHQTRKYHFFVEVVEEKTTFTYDIEKILSMYPEIRDNKDFMMQKNQKGYIKISHIKQGNP